MTCEYEYGIFSVEYEESETRTLALSDFIVKKAVKRLCKCIVGKSFCLAGTMSVLAGE